MNNNLQSRVEGIQKNHIYHTSSKPRPVIVKFARYNIREKVFKSKKTLKAKNISITESLTGYRMSVLNEAREKFGFKNAWIYDGRILYKDNNQARNQEFFRAGEVS